MLGSSREKNDAESIELVRKFEAKKKKLLRSLEDLGELEAIKKLRELQVPLITSPIYLWIRSPSCLDQFP